MFVRASVLFAVVAVAGCLPSEYGTNKPVPRQPNNTNAADVEMFCYQESSTGSNIAHSVCRPKTADEMDTPATPVTPATPAPGRPNQSGK